MQVTCSNCGARYAVDPGALGPDGRTVQCARCSHRWFEKPVVASPAPAGSGLNDGPVPDFVIRPQAQSTGQKAGLPALTRPRAKSPWGRWLMAGAAAIVVLGVAAFAWRAELRPILQLEAFSTLFASPSKVTRPAPPDQARLVVDIDASKIELVDGRYVVQGEVVNTGRRAGSTSMLRLTFRKNDDVLGERAYPLVRGPIGPGARSSFTQALDDPPAGTTDVVPAVE